MGTETSSASSGFPGWLEDIIEFTGRNDMQAIGIYDSAEHWVTGNDGLGQTRTPGSHVMPTLIRIYDIE
jgi:hypothetical protein